MRTGGRGVIAACGVVIVLSGCARPVPVAERPAEDSPVLAFGGVTTTAPATPSTTAPAPVARPIDVPADPYAPEPVRRIGTIEISRIGLRHDVYEGITLNNIDHGPSHWPGSALPGEVGNAVFAGHRVTHSHPFRRIDELVAGDTVVFDIAATRTTYRVTEMRVVTPRDTWIATPTATPTATLFACHPPGSARYRYVVHLELVPSPQPAPGASSETPLSSM
jgi:sortase A